MNFLTASTSTTITAGIYLPPGEYKFLAEIPTGDAAAVAVYQRKSGNTDNMPVVQSGTAISLTVTDPSRIIVSGGEEFLVHRASGSAAITVSASLYR